jgi:cerevisin
MASPHICGLLAYFLSLQPSQDSAYAVADITPKKMKENMLAIGTTGALSDVPSNTANLLAWNGGGKTNYSEIVNDGGYNAGSADKHINMVPSSIKNELKHIAEELEHLVDY